MAKKKNAPPWWMTPKGILQLKFLDALITVVAIVGFLGMPWLSSTSVMQENALMPGGLHTCLQED